MVVVESAFLSMTVSVIKLKRIRPTRIVLNGLHRVLFNDFENRYTCFRWLDRRPVIVLFAGPIILNE